MTPDTSSRSLGGAAAGRAVEGPLERETELHVIEELLGALPRRHGSFLIIEGASGIGKSRLLSVARALSEAAGYVVLSARAGELEQDYPFGVVLRLFEPLHARDTDEDREGLLGGRAALARPLLAPDVASTPAPATTTDEFQLIQGLYWAAVNLTEERPLVVIVDDLHWADELSLRFLIYLAERVTELPVALLCSIRTDTEEARRDLPAHLSTIAHERLSPAALSLDAVRRLLTERMRSVSDDVAVASLRTTGGNPFLVHELAAEVASQQDQGVQIDAARVSSFAPQSVRRRTVLRLQRMGPDTLDVARATAVLGDHAHLHLVAQLVDLDLQSVVATAERLVTSEIFETSDPPAFAHPILRSAVHEELPPGTGPEMHAIAARLLRDAAAPPELIAHHLVGATPVIEPWAREALHEGARAVARKGAPGTAVRFLRRALEFSGRDDRTAEILVDLGIVEAAAGEMTSLGRLEDALTMLDDPAEETRALNAFGLTLFRYGRHIEAAQTFHRGVELFRERDPEAARTFEASLLWATILDPERHRASARRVEELAADINPAGDLDAVDRVLLTQLALQRVLTLPPASEAAALALEAYGDHALLTDYLGDGIPVHVTIFVLWLAGRSAEAHDLADRVLREAGRRGTALTFAEGSNLRARILLARGQIAAATSDAQASIAGMKRGWHMGTMPHATLAECLIEQGQLEAAAEALGHAPIDLSPIERTTNVWFLAARGRLRLLRGEPGAALDDLLVIRDTLAAVEAENPTLAPWRSLAGIALHRLGDTAAGQTLIDEELALARSFVLPAQMGVALHRRALLEDRKRAERTLTEAVAVLEPADAPLELARALAALGAAQRRAGRRAASREPLRRALDLAHRCGATAIERQAREELLASGARPRSPVLSGVEALTPSERRIAELAAAGRSNAEIAELLFLTRNTVAWHLTHVYRKLDVDSRSRLGALFETESP